METTTYDFDEFKNLVEEDGRADNINKQPNYRKQNTRRMIENLLEDRALEMTFKDDYM